MSNIITEGVGSLCSRFFIDYGKELNSNRALPMLMDGLKPSYRRAIYTAIQAPGNHMKSLDFVGNMFKMHPHGDKSIVGVETKLVRAHIFKELANFGYYPIYGTQSPAAAPRYTETGVEDNWYKIMNELIDVVPYMDGEVEGVREPAYLATPIPISLVIGGRGVALGMNTNIPSFDPKSILDAYLNNDPSLLKSYYDLEIDYENSELDRLWNDGVGRVIYKYHITPETDASGCQGVAIEGDTQVFIPNWEQIDDWRDQGLLFVRDESTGGHNRIFIGKNKNVRKISVDDILEECNLCCSSLYTFSQIQYTYKLGIYDGTIGRYISMKEWVDTTYKNYIDLISKYKEKNIDKLNFDKSVYNNLRSVADILMNAENDISNEEIANQLEISTDIVAAITRKSISTLKRCDTEGMIASIDGKINYYDSIKPKKFIKTIISEM